MIPKVVRSGFRALSWMIVIVLLLVVTIIVFGAMQLPVDRMLPMGSFDAKLLLELLLVLILWLITTLIHEGGHFLAARAQGMTVSEVRLWWLVLTPRRRGYRLQIKRGPGWVGGWVKATVGPGSLRRQMVLLILGGPASNIAFACVSAALVWPLYLHGMKIAVSIFASLALTNLYIGLGNLLPIGIRIASDGSLLYHWLFESHKDPGALALLRLMGLSVRGLRARDYAPEDLQLLIQSPLSIRKLVGSWLMLRGAIDRGDIPAAQRIFEDCRSVYEGASDADRKLLDGTWKHCLLESAYLKARHERSSDEAHRLFESSALVAMPAFMRLRLEAAMHCATGDRQQAQYCLAQARHDLDETHDIGTRLEESDLLDDIGVQLQAPALSR